MYIKATWKSWKDTFHSWTTYIRQVIQVKKQIEKNTLKVIISEKFGGGGPQIFDIVKWRQKKSFCLASYVEICTT